jgi:hypothetical protein
MSTSLETFQAGLADDQAQSARVHLIRPVADARIPVARAIHAWHETDPCSGWLPESFIEEVRGKGTSPINGSPKKLSELIRSGLNRNPDRRS